MPAKHSASVSAHSEKMQQLRHLLGWSQLEASVRTGYSERVIRKVESGQLVRKRTLREILQCYFEAGKGLFGEQPWTAYLANEGDKCLSLNQTDFADAESVTQLLNYFRGVYEDRQIELIEKYVHPDIEFTSDGTDRTGIEAIRTRAKTFLNGFNPIQLEIESAYCLDMTVILTFVATMKHAGEFLGVAQSGKVVTVRNCSIAHYDGRRFDRCNDQTDIAHLMAQLTNQEPPVV